MVQTWSMTSINPKIGNPPTIVEKQLQTLLATIEQFTQQNEALVQHNQALEVQIEQLRKPQPEANNHQKCSNHH